MAVQTNVGIAVPNLRIRRQRDWLPYMLALPILIYEGIFILIPILQQISTSFSSDVFGLSNVNWVGLTNYNRMFADRNFWHSIQVTLIYMVATVVLAVIIGLVAALILDQRFPGRTLARAIMTLPWAMPDIPTAIIFFWILNPSFGVINVFARLLLPWLQSNPHWLNDFNLALPAVITISAWKAFPFYGLVLLSVMQAIPHELYEAARVDGANPRQIFRHITFPELVPTLMLMAVLAAIFSFRQFVLIYMETGGGPGRTTETLVISVYKAAFINFDFSYASTIGVAGFVTVFVITILFVFLQRRQAAETAQ